MSIKTDISRRSFLINGSKSHRPAIPRQLFTLQCQSSTEKNDSINPQASALDVHGAWPFK